jgi:hypothetical protein
MLHGIQCLAVFWVRLLIEASREDAAHRAQSHLCGYISALHVMISRLSLAGELYGRVEDDGCGCTRVVLIRARRCPGHVRYPCCKELQHIHLKSRLQEVLRRCGDRSAVAQAMTCTMRTTFPRRAALDAG